MEEDHGVDEQGEEEVDEHTANHDEQALPGGFCAELPGVCLFRQLLVGFVDHTVDGAVATKGQPAEAVLRTYVFLYLRLCGLTLVVFFFHFLGGNLLGRQFQQSAHPGVIGTEDVELGIEEQIELGDAHLEEFCKREVPQFVEQNKQADSQQELK